GVSTATADRAINKRAGVRDTTAKRVLRAAVAVDYLTEEEAAEAMQPRPMKAVFLRPAGKNPYLALLGRVINRIASDSADNSMTIQRFFIDSFDPERLAESLLRYGRKADCIAFMGIDHPLVRE